MAFDHLLEDYKAFETLLPDLIQDHHGQIVVVHSRRVIDFFPSMEEAVEFGDQTYGAGEYIAQLVVYEEPTVVSYSLITPPNPMGIQLRRRRQSRA